ncbi:MAG: serine hydrolase [Opitutus sp.]|nr:serine hydrolase [Opitutus sp.]
MQSAIVQKVTGQSVLDYLRPRLFDPLGIENPQWQADAHGISLGGFGLSGRTEDIAKFGQLYLQKGKWQGKPLVPATWVELATARHVSNGSNPESDWEQGYGFQFWRSRHGFYRGDGAFGQFCIVLEELDAVVAITSGTRDMGHVMNLVWEKLVPAMKPKALRADKAAHEKLTRAVAALTIPPPAANGSKPADAVTAQFGRTYRFEANEQQIESVSIAKGSDAGSHVVRFQMADRTNEFVCGDAWRRSRQAVSHQPEQDVATAGAWTADDTFTLKLCLVETPFIVTMKLRFDGDTVSLDSEYNVGFGDPKRPTLTGRAE